MGRLNISWAKFDGLELDEGIREIEEARAG